MYAAIITEGKYGTDYRIETYDVREYLDVALLIDEYADGACVDIGALTYQRGWSEQRGQVKIETADNLIVIEWES